MNDVTTKKYCRPVFLYFRAKSVRSLCNSTYLERLRWCHCFGLKQPCRITARLLTRRVYVSGSCEVAWTASLAMAAMARDLLSRLGSAESFRQSLELNPVQPHGNAV